MANPWKFLDHWADKNVHATAYDDEATAKGLAAQCLEAATEVGLSAAAVVKAAGGNLVSFLLDRLNSAADREVDRLSSKHD